MRSQEFTSEEARQIGDRLSVDWEKFDTLSSEETEILEESRF